MNQGARCFVGGGFVEERFESADHTGGYEDALVEPWKPRPTSQGSRSCAIRMHEATAPVPSNTRSILLTATRRIGPGRQPVLLLVPDIANPDFIAAASTGEADDRPRSNVM